MTPHDPVLIAFLDAARSALGEAAGAAAGRAAQSAFHAFTVALSGAAAFVLLRAFRRLGRQRPDAPGGDGAGLRVFHALFFSCLLLCVAFGDDVFHAHAIAVVLLGLAVAVALFLLAVRGGGRGVERLRAWAKARREGTGAPPPPLPLRGEPLARRGARALRRALLPPLVTAGVVVVVAGLWLVVGNALGRSACRDAMRIAAGGDGAGAGAEGARNDSSPTALRLVELARELGLDLTPAPGKGPALDPGRVEAMKKASEAIREHLIRRGRRPDDELVRAPEPVRDFLFVHRETLDRVRGLLDGGEVPLWEYRPAEGFEAPVPAYLSLLRLSHLLVADAYEAAADGDGARAASDLAASFSVSKGLAARSERYAQLCALLMRSTQMGLVRKLDAPTGWEERLLEGDLRAQLARSAEREARCLARFGLEGCPGLGTGDTAFAGAVAALVRPAMRLSLASSARRLATTLAAATALGYDALAMRARSRALDPVFPAWDLFGPASARPGPALVRLSRFEIDRDLTLTVLRLKARARKAAGAPRAAGVEAEGSVPSIARGRSWRYRIRDGRLAEVRLDGAWPAPADDYAMALAVSWVGHRELRRPAR